jgi:hypothetical protein
MFERVTDIYFKKTKKPTRFEMTAKMIVTVLRAVLSSTGNLLRPSRPK